MSIVSEVGQFIDWTDFWANFRNYTYWTLECFDGNAWQDVKKDLVVQRTYPKADECKFKLIFTASKKGDYRLTFVLNKTVRDYFERLEDCQCVMEYEGFLVTFDYSDIKNIIGLEIHRGITDTYFWFRVERKSVPQGTYELDPSTVGTSTSADATSLSFQRKSFYANGRYWVFYSDGTNMVFRSSTDGVTWSDATTVRASTSGGKFSIYFDGTYVHYAYCNGGSGDDLFYRRGTPNPDGTITWSAAEQTAQDVPTGEYFTRLSMAVDSNGYPFIAWMEDAGDDPEVTKSSTNDGTWSTASGFPYTLMDGAGAGWGVSVIPLTGGKMYVIYAASRYSPEQAGWLWNGSSWGSKETITSSTLNRGPSAWDCPMCATAKDDDVYYVFLEETSNDIHFRKRTYGSGWGSEETVQSAAINSAFPVISINSANGDVYCFWAGSPTAHHIYYKKRTSGGTWDTDPTDWINESTDSLTANTKLTSAFRDYNSKIILVYMTKTASPYNVRFASLSITAVTNINVSDSAVGGEIVNRPERLITLLDQAAGADVVTRPYREMTVTDLANCLEALFKLREMAAVTDGAAGLELVTVGVAGVIKTRIFLILGGLAIQLTGD